MVAPHPWRPAIAKAGLIKSFMWDILWDTPKHRAPKHSAIQAIGLIVSNPPSEPNMGKRERGDDHETLLRIVDLSHLAKNISGVNFPLSSLALFL